MEVVNAALRLVVVLQRGIAVELPVRIGEGGQEAAVRSEDQLTTIVRAELHLVTPSSTCIKDVAAPSRSKSSSLTLLLLLMALPTRLLLRKRRKTGDRL